MRPMPISTVVLRVKKIFQNSEKFPDPQNHCWYFLTSKAGLNNFTAVITGRKNFVTIKVGL